MYMPERFQLVFDPEYSRLDRRALIEVFHERFPGFPESRLQTMARQQIISLILEQEGFSAPETDGGDLSAAVPIHRLHSAKDYDLPKSLAPAQSMYYCWEDEISTIGAAVSLAKGDVSTREWNLGEDVLPGSLLLTVLNTTPPLVSALETVTHVDEEKVWVDQLAVFSDPISLYELESMIDSGLPRSSKALSISTAKRVLKSLIKLTKVPRPMVVSAGRCDPDSVVDANDAVHVLALLQRDYDDVTLCDGCGRDVDAKTSIHFFRPPGENLNWDIQDHVDAAGLLCGQCHDLVHGPSKTRLRQILAVAPPCPECGEGNPRKALWGMPSSAPGDDEVAMGCVMPVGPMTEWICRHCDTPYAVVAHPEKFMSEERVNSILEQRNQPDRTQ